MSKKSSSFKNQIIYWYLTERCNLQCKHCWVSASPDSKLKEELSLEEIVKILDQCVDLGLNRLIFSGGEPLVRKDILSIMREVIKRKLFFSIETNGLLIEEELIEIFLNTTRSYRPQFAISLDGGSAKHHDYLRGNGTFARTLKKLEILRDNDLSFSLQCVINQMNIDTVFSIIQIAERLNVKSLTFAFLHPVGRAVDNSNNLNLDRQSFLQAVKNIIDASSDSNQFPIDIKIPPAILPPEYLVQMQTKANLNIISNCLFPNLGITADGKVTLCSLTKDLLVYGDLRINSLKETIEKARFKEIHQAYISGEKLEGVCAECRFKYSCKGSCRSLAYHEFGSLHAAHPFCAKLEMEGNFPELYKQCR